MIIKVSTISYWVQIISSSLLFATAGREQQFSFVHLFVLLHHFHLYVDIWLAILLL